MAWNANFLFMKNAKINERPAAGLNIFMMRGEKKSKQNVLEQ